MDKVYVCSPYGGDHKNLLYAQKCVLYVLKKGHAPFAPHLQYGPVLNEDEDRKLGMDAGNKWLRISDVVMVFADRGISPGMREEMATAREQRIPIQTIKIEEFK
ncbi:MAG: hypothetical protein KAS32_14470 [Candidatus Peribacteraceae bacterium]|nr:hypothetical protein [Candidatus Peribacteraceae bacterium]